MPPLTTRSQHLYLLYHWRTDTLSHWRWCCSQQACFATADFLFSGSCLVLLYTSTIQGFHHVGLLRRGSTSSPLVVPSERGDVMKTVLMSNYVLHWQRSRWNLEGYLLSNYRFLIHITKLLQILHAVIKISLMMLQVLNLPPTVLLVTEDQFKLQKVGGLQHALFPFPHISTIASLHWLHFRDPYS